MTVTFTLLARSSTMLKYLVTADGASTGEVRAENGVSPDLLTDSVQGPLNLLFQKRPANPTQGQNLFFAQATLIVSVLRRTAGITWTSDATIDSGNVPVFRETASGADALGAIVTFEFQHSLEGSGGNSGSAGALSGNGGRVSG